MPCISDNDLVELLEGKLDEPRRGDVLAELAACTRCRALARDWALLSLEVTTAPTASAAPIVPGELDGYAIGELLGAGAMGLVFRARDVALDRDVALKVVRDDPRALDEGRLLATVRHPNVVTVHAARAGGGLAYLALELAAGTSLDRVLARGPLAWRTAARWFAGVASGLAAVHRAGIVHRDIKPANLLVDGDQLRIADFGLAATRPDVPLAGTPAYLAPELLAGAPATPAADQFAFWVALYQSVCGRLPEPDALVGRNARRIPAPLRRGIARGLADEPARRWPDMAAIERALAQIARPRRWPIAAALAVAAVAAIIVGWAWRAPAACAVPEPGWRARLASHDRLSGVISAYEHRWQAAYADACAAPPGPSAPRACLDRARDRVDDVLAQATRDADAVQAIAGLASPARCLSGTEPRARVAASPAARRAAALRLLGRARDARDALPDPRNDDAALALLRGQLAQELLELAAAEAAYRRASELASQDDDAATIADASTGLAVVIGSLQDRHDAGLAYADAALAAARRIGDPRRVREARAARAVVTAARGDRLAAIAELTQLAAELAPDPDAALARATLELRIAVLRREAGQPDARSHLDRARSLRVAALGPDHPLVAQVDVELGIADATDGNYAAAIARHRATLARLTAQLGDADIALAGAWSSLGTALIQHGDYADAAAALQRAIELRIAAFGERNLDVVRARVNLASAHYYAGDLARAIAAYRGAHVVARSLLGDHHPDVALIGTGLAIALQGAGRLDEADVAIRESVAAYRTLAGHDLALAGALTNQGSIELSAGHVAQARRALEDSLAIHERLLGAEDVELAWPLSALGDVYLAAGELAAADQVIHRARALRERTGAAPQVIAENNYALAQVRWRRGDRAEARRLAATALDQLGDARPDARREIAAWLAARGGPPARHR